MYESFIDLDELIVRCRDKSARKFIQEAVACYKVGAFRSCIVATWNAVVFDFLHKLRELALLDNKEASQILEDFEKISTASSSSNTQQLWKFECNIPKLALERFELISDIEYLDIERLFQDRSRCAHPSMASLEEPFEAPAELARYHLRSAVTHLLQRPPVQGRSAKKWIDQTIKSDYFARNLDEAIICLSKGPLARARLNLIKDVVIGLTVSLLKQDLPESERRNQFLAINAIATIHHQETRDTLNEKLSEIILNKTSDTDWDKVIIYLSEVKAWDVLSEPVKLKARNFISKLQISVTSSRHFKPPHNSNIKLLLKASRLEFLRDILVSKLQIPLVRLIDLKELCSRDDLPNEIVLSLINDKILEETDISQLIAIQNDEVFGDIITNVIKEKIPQANWSQLLSIRGTGNTLLSQEVEPFLAREIKYASLNDLFFLTESEDTFLDELVKQNWQDKVVESSLSKLLEIKEYEPFFLRKETLGNLFDSIDHHINKSVKTSDLEELILLRRKYSNDLFEKLVNLRLRDNPAPLLKGLLEAGSYDNSCFYSRLILEISDSLSSTEWQSVLEAFCENNQIYNSRNCRKVFYELFKKSLETQGCVQSYWIDFQEKLNKFSQPDIKALQDMIVSSIQE